MSSSQHPYASQQAVKNDESNPAENPWWRSAAPPRPKIRTIFVATLASFVALTLLAAITASTGYMLLIPPMAASMALVMGAPKLPLSQPRNVIGGQTVSATVGVLTGMAGNSLWLGALAGGLALGAMMLTRTPHSPAAATAIIGVTTASSGLLFIGLAAVAALLLVLVGAAANTINSARYPTYIW